MKAPDGCCTGGPVSEVIEWGSFPLEALWKCLSATSTPSPSSNFLIRHWDFDVFCLCPWWIAELITGITWYCNKYDTSVGCRVVAMGRAPMSLQRRWLKKNQRYIYTWSQPISGLGEGSSSWRSVDISKDSGVQTSFACQSCCPVTTFAFITVYPLTDLFTSLSVNLRSICACWL